MGLRTVKQQARGGSSPATAQRPQGPSGALFGSLYESPVGELAVAVDDRGVVGLRLPERGGHGPTMGDTRGVRDQDVVWEREPVRTAEAMLALDRYFEGDADAFRSLPMMPHGTDFQMRVWEACARVPFGVTATYGDLAAAVGRPQAARAVGGAMNRNPIAIMVPCHRIVGSTGSLTGYGGGLGVKAWLLRHEGLEPRSS